MTTLPTQARIVIVGGGIAGCSTAYHLAKLGERDVLLLEQGRLTCGTTWHAAGLVGQMRPNRHMTQMSRYGIELYASLEQETGLATGWKACGSVNVAASAERMQVYLKQAALARRFGVELEVIDARRAGELYPLLRTDDLHGALWIPGDGKANPTDLTMSLAKGARQRGVKIVEGVEVTGVLQRDGAVTGIRTAEGNIACEILVNCAGQWARQFGRLAGVNVPLYSAEHFYVVTAPLDGVHPMLPVMRDPDGRVYYKEEVGGLVMGGFEPQAKPWTMDPIPASFQFQLLDEDWDQFEPLMRSAMHRTPCLETAKIKMLLNGPESFTPDGNFILGEAPELRHCFVAAGFNSAGIANAGGAGRLMAEWIVGGEPPGDVSEVDIRRFAPFTANRRWLAERTGETLGLHYAMRWPRQELASSRPLRTSPLYDLLAARGAVFGSKNGWERANYFKPIDAPEPAHGLGRPGWLAWVAAEQRATRESVALYDKTSFGKLLVEGRDALALLQRLCANDIDVPLDRIVYTAMLNERAGFESDLTVIRTGAERFLLITGSAQPTRDADWIRRHIGPDEHVVLVDVSAQTAVLSLMGPSALALLARCSPDDLSPAALPFAHTREIDVGFARVRAARMSYVGGPGAEFYVPIETARHVYLTLQKAGADLGLVDAGYFALDALRIEAGRRAWGAEIGPDTTPLEAGLMRGVRLDKPTPFIGQTALQRAAGEPPRARLVTVVLDDPQAWAWGGETLRVDGEAAGELTSAGWGHGAQRCVALGWLHGDAARREHHGSAVEVDVWGVAMRATAWDRWPPANAAAPAAPASAPGSPPPRA
ncbi:MAG TPA: FAD-dependent oxidoreductase [Burkholderiaceae bacterium]|nr:FAD-dependent oxidoreductase [Burkholderiaceae bacterium]